MTTSTEKIKSLCNDVLDLNGNSSLDYIGDDKIIARRFRGLMASSKKTVILKFQNTLIDIYGPDILEQISSSNWYRDAVNSFQNILNRRVIERIGCKFWNYVRWKTRLECHDFFFYVLMGEMETTRKFLETKDNAKDVEYESRLAQKQLVVDQMEKYSNQILENPNLAKRDADKLLKLAESCKEGNIAMGVDTPGGGANLAIDYGSLLNLIATMRDNGASELQALAMFITKAMHRDLKHFQDRWAARIGSNNSTNNTTSLETQSTPTAAAIDTTAYTVGEPLSSLRPLSSPIMSPGESSTGKLTAKTTPDGFSVEGEGSPSSRYAIDMSPNGELVEGSEEVDGYVDVKGGESCSNTSSGSWFNWWFSNPNQ